MSGSSVLWWAPSPACTPYPGGTTGRVLNSVGVLGEVLSPCVLRRASSPACTPYLGDTTGRVLSSVGVLGEVLSPCVLWRGPVAGLYTVPWWYTVVRRRGQSSSRRGRRASGRRQCAAVTRLGSHLGAVASTVGSVPHRIVRFATVVENEQSIKLT